MDPAVTILCPGTQAHPSEQAVPPTLSPSYLMQRRFDSDLRFAKLLAIDSHYGHDLDFRSFVNSRKCPVPTSHKLQVEPLPKRHYLVGSVVVSPSKKCDIRSEHKRRIFARDERSVGGVCKPIDEEGKNEGLVAPFGGQRRTDAAAWGESKG